MVRIGVLTSSRADFGVYEPLLNSLREDSDIELGIIAFGTHLSRQHGFTLDEILLKKFQTKYTIPSLLADDSEEAISTSYALTSLKFSTFWAEHGSKFDIVFCMGDRFEMFAAVIAGVPFGIKFAHFYGGDYTLGAIDNVFRDCMTHCSILHFTSTNKCAERVKMLTGSDKGISAVGILSLAGSSTLDLLSAKEFQYRWKIDLSVPTILMTIHPDTIETKKNYTDAKIIFNVTEKLQEHYQIVITMPNADTNGSIYRNMFKKLADNESDKIYLVENFGIQSYFSCMKYSKLVIGNTSSGITESATFNKYFVNIGNRQKGRETGENVISVPFDEKSILTEVHRVLKKGEFHGKNIYYQKNSLKKIIKIVKESFNGKY